MGQENASLPNVVGPTVDGVRASSLLLTPERELSFLQVSMPGKSVTSTVAEPMALVFPFNVAVISLGPAVNGGVNKPLAVMLPPLAAQITSLLPIPAVVTFNCNVCEVVTLESFGDSESA